MKTNTLITIGELTYRIHNSNIQRVFYGNERGINISSLTVPSHFQDKENHYLTIIGIEPSPKSPKLLNSYPLEFWFKRKYNYKGEVGKTFWYKFFAQIDSLFNYQCEKTLQNHTPVDYYENLFKKYPFAHDIITTQISNDPDGLLYDYFIDDYFLSPEDNDRLYNKLYDKYISPIHSLILDELEDEYLEDGITQAFKYDNGPFSPYSQFCDAEDKQGKKFAYQPNFHSVSPFHELREIKRIELSKGFQEIDSYGFSQMDLLQQIILPDTIKQIGDYAFLFTSSLKEISLPSSIQEIGIATFAFSGIQKIEWPPFDRVPQFTFDHSNLEQITLPNNIITLEKGCFGYCQLKGIRIPDSVTKIGESAFEGCTSLKEVGFSNSLTKLDDRVFEDCTQLTSLQLPSSLKRIGKNCFKNCTSLSEITLPDSLTHLGPEAFKNCSALTELWLPKSWESSRQDIVHDILEQCPALHTIHLSRKMVFSSPLPSNINLQYYD